MEWGGGFFTAVTEQFGLKWWWRHEPAIREMFWERSFDVEKLTDRVDTQPRPPPRIAPHAGTLMRALEYKSVWSPDHFVDPPTESPRYIENRDGSKTLVAVREARARAVPTRCLNYASFVELMTKLTMARLELADLGARAPTGPATSADPERQEQGAMGVAVDPTRQQRGLGLTPAEEHVHVVSYGVSRVVHAMNKLFS